MDDGDSLPEAYQRAIRKDLECLRKDLELHKDEPVLRYVISELQEAVKRNDQTKVFQILNALSQDWVSSAILTFLSSERLTYWMGRRQGPPPLEWLNPDARTPQTQGFLQKSYVKKWLSKRTRKPSP